MQTLALEGPLDAAQRDCIETAQDSAGHLLAILNDILDFSKAETCHIELHAQPVEVLRFLEETVDSLRGLASRKSIGLELKAHRGLPLAVMADPVRLRQILLNLLNNAIKFTEFGEVVLHVDPVATDGVRFAVVDTGIGIPRDQVGRVLEAFYQVDGSNTRAYGGTGLGLAIADRLIRQMSGQLAIKSEVGVGSDFHFTLPLAQTEAPAQPRQAAPASAQPLVGLTILLAEDNAVNLKLLTMVLQRRGAKVIIATDGQQALDAHASGSADLILMDVQMPVLDGLGATCRIREREERTGGHHTPIIGLTAHVLAGDRERCIAAGMDLYLEKPIDLPQLLNCIEALVRPSAFTGLSESNAMLKATPSQL